MTYLYEDIPLEFPEKRNVSLRKFYTLGPLLVMHVNGDEFTDMSESIANICEMADKLDAQDFQQAISFYSENPYRWDLGDFETAYCPECKKIINTACHQLSDGDFSVECPECSFVFKD